MEEKFKIIKEILILLFKEQARLWRLYHKPIDTDALYKILPPILHEGQIISLLERENGRFKSDFCDYGKFLYLPPLERDSKFIPILELKCDLDKSELEISFYVTLYRWFEEKAQFEQIGFRFEGPHEGPVHNYWHVQLIHGIAGISTTQSLASSNSIPVKIPCIPVKARCPVSLLLCMLFSFYGDKILEDIFHKLRGRHNKPLIAILENFTNEIYPSS